MAKETVAPATIVLYDGEEQPVAELAQIPRAIHRVVGSRCK